MKLRCELIVSDFDGTLANSENTVDEKVVAAINRYVDAGGIFAVCTGRILPSVLPRVRALGLKGLVVGCQGSVIADIESGKIIRDIALSGAQTAEVCAFLEELGAPINIYFSDGLYSNIEEGNVHLNTYEKITGVKALHTDKPLSVFAAECGNSFNKVAVLCAPKDREELYKKISARFSRKYDVTCSAQVLIEISPAGETKGAALKYLAAHYKIPIEKTCAVGDNLNDLSMLLAAGYGVAVGNACEELKRQAPYITVTNDEGAVGRVIEEFGFSND